MVELNLRALVLSGLYAQQNFHVDDFPLHIWVAATQNSRQHNKMIIQLAVRCYAMTKENIKCKIAFGLLLEDLKPDTLFYQLGCF